jgi:CubicO group peptidase (beta-lactamase class C family)
MTASGVDSDDLVLPQRAQGYDTSPHRLVHAVFGSMSVPWAAGGIYSTTGDLIRWEHGLFGGKLLSSKSLGLMTTPGKGRYGLGLWIDRRDGIKVVEHAGLIEGFTSSMRYVPERKIGVVALGNVFGFASGALLINFLISPWENR